VPIVLALALLAAVPARAERVRLALLPVLVHSSESREYLQQGLSDMLVARLGRDARLAVIEVQDAATATTDPSAAREVARREGAAWVVFGSFTRFGEGASLDLQVARAAESEDDPRQVFTQAATLGALIPMLESVSERITGYVFGGAAEAGGPGEGGGSGEVAELRRRVEALERAVSALGASRMPDEPSPATVQPPGPKPESQ